MCLCVSPKKLVLLEVFMPEIIWAKFFKTRLTIEFTVKSDLRSESFKRIFSIIVFVYHLLPGCSKKNWRKLSKESLWRESRLFVNTRSETGQTQSCMSMHQCNQCFITVGKDWVWNNIYTCSCQLMIAIGKQTFIAKDNMIKILDLHTVWMNF